MNIRRALASTLAAAALAGGLGVAAAAPASAAPQDCSYLGYHSGPDQLGLKLDSQETKLFREINAYRAAHGVPALTFSHGLARPTMWGSIDSANRGFSPSDHVDSRGMGVADRARFCSGYVGWVGEINFYGWGSQEAGSRTSALRWWKGSPGHNALLLSRDYTTMSVGRAYIGVNAEVRQHWTVMFGRG